MKSRLRQLLIENSEGSVWYHGTPDSRELEKAGGFSERKISVEYVKDINAFNEIQLKLKNTREAGEMDKYHQLLD